MILIKSLIGLKKIINKLVQMKKKKLIAIGDIHGRDTWKFKLFGSSYEFEKWVTQSVEPNTQGMPYQYPFGQYDKIIFIGDYVDSFTVNNIQMKKNLEDIISFKKACPDKVVLLLGNHDVQYIVDNTMCSGFRPEMKWDFGDIFNKNIDLFTMAHVVDTPHYPTLFTHAGVTTEWVEELREEFRNDVSHKRDMFSEHAEDPIPELINSAWTFQMSSLFNVDSASGGSSKWAGCLWARPAKLKKYGVSGYNQVVGHTPVKSVQTHPIKDGTENVVHLIDCLEHYDSEDYLELEY